MCSRPFQVVEPPGFGPAGDQSALLRRIDGDILEIDDVGHCRSGPNPSYQVGDRHPPRSSSSGNTLIRRTTRTLLRAAALVEDVD